MLAHIIKEERIGYEHGANVVYAYFTGVQMYAVLYFRKGLNVSYSGVVSGRLGRSSSKEQYGFLYRYR